MKSLIRLFGWSETKADQRSEFRIRSGCRLTLTWQDHRGRRRSARARVLDMNGTGAHVRTGAAILPGSYVLVQAKELGLSGSALVRRAEADLFTYRLGLQFSGSLTTRF